MRHSKVITFLALILFLASGLTNAAQTMVMAATTAESMAQEWTVDRIEEQSAEPCAKMAMEHGSGLVGQAQHSPDSHQCNLECNCCPGSCSSSVALISDQGWRVSPAANAPAERYSAHPQRDNTRLLRPPIST